MHMNSRKTILIWSAVFAAIGVLSLDYWRWDDPVQLGLLGMPSWIWYFVLLQLLLINAIGLFIKLVWRKASHNETLPDV